MQQIDHLAPTVQRPARVTQQRFRHGLQFQASYSFTRDLSTDAFTTSGANGGQSTAIRTIPKQRYGPDYFIRPHRFITNFTYQFLPTKIRARQRQTHVAGCLPESYLPVGHPLTLSYNHFAGEPASLAARSLTPIALWHLHNRHYLNSARQI